jgi:hypothetical protein
MALVQRIKIGAVVRDVVAGEHGREEIEPGLPRLHAVDAREIDRKLAREARAVRNEMAVARHPVTGCDARQALHDEKTAARN